MEEPGQCNYPISHYPIRGCLLLTTFLPMKANTPAVTSPANITNRQAKNCRGRRESHISEACSWGCQPAPRPPQASTAHPEPEELLRRLYKGLPRQISCHIQTKGKWQRCGSEGASGKSEGNSREYIPRDSKGTSTCTPALQERGGC